MVTESRRGIDHLVERPGVVGLAIEVALVLADLLGRIRAVLWGGEGEWGCSEGEQGESDGEADRSHGEP